MRAVGDGAAAAVAAHPVRPDWLARVSEPALDPDLPIVDAHHHLWDMPGSRYLWTDYLRDIADGHNVIASVFIGAGAPTSNFDETGFAAVVADHATATAGPAVAAAIVAAVDFRSGSALGAGLDAHRERSVGRLRGVRSLVHWDADPAIHHVDTTPQMLSLPSTTDALREIQRRDLVLDLWVYHTQLGEVAAVARCFPCLRIVLDHTGTPLGCGRFVNRADEVRSAWHTGLAELATLPNVCLKIGGLGMRFTGFAFDRNPLPPTSEYLANAWRPYIETAIELFGPSRCMFESNFPVDKASCSHVVLWNAFKRICASASNAERRRLFAGTAIEVYALDAITGW